MIEIAKQVTENYQIRKSYKQKTDFIELIKNYSNNLEYAVDLNKGGIFKSRNIVVGDVNKAKYIFTAHYDTCAQLPIPNFITPTNPFVILLYNILVVLLFMVFSLTIAVSVFLLTNNNFLRFISGELSLLLCVYLMIFGKANKNNYNDNTSGVVTLLEIMSKLDADKRENVAFVFFDNEEKGLIGSMYFKKTYKKALDEKLFINFDCVGDGDNIMFVTSKAVRNSTYQEELETINCGDASKNILFIGSNKAIYPSDQINFKTLLESVL